MTEVFLDTSYAIALASRRDQHDEKALELAEYIEQQELRKVTTRAVVLEIGNALSTPRFRQTAVNMLEYLDHDPTIEIIPLSELLYQQGFELFRQRPDKEGGLVDCISFIVMQDRGITDALTADDHFLQAGFIPLLSDR